MQSSAQRLPHADRSSNARYPPKLSAYISRDTTPKEAVLTIPTGMGRNWTLAAKGESRESIVAALQSLFEVTATALGKFQGNVFKSPSTPSEITGGMIDESLVKTTKDSSWTSMFGS
jgi:hypothetical protein